MDFRPKRTLLLALVVVVAGLFVIQVGNGLWTASEADSPHMLAIEELKNNSEEYLGQRVVVEGWYQGGLIRDANPLCANTREGVQQKDYTYIFADIRTRVTLVTGVEYRFVGTLRPASEIDKPTIQSQPIFVVREVKRIGRNPDECSFLPTTEQN